MLNNETVATLKQLIGDGRLDDAFVLLEQALGELPDDFIKIRGRYNDAIKDFNTEIIDHKDYKLIIGQCRHAFLESLKSYEPRTDKKEKQYRFHPNHQHTCDRSAQYNPFEALLDEAENARIHYFYLHGGESHKHESLFQRFVNRARGEEKPTGYQIVDISISNLDADIDLNRLAFVFAKAVLIELGNEEIECQKISTRSLAWGIDNGNQTRQFGKNGKILLHLSITDALWRVRPDEQAEERQSTSTPEQVISFIREFCEKEKLPADGPEVFFFFSIEYPNHNETIKKEIDMAMRGASHLKNMGELQMVTQLDVKNWFTKYRRKWDDDDEREAAYKDHFGDEPDKMYMKTVIRKLKKVIDNMNNGNDHDKRP